MSGIYLRWRSSIVSSSFRCWPYSLVVRERLLWTWERAIVHLMPTPSWPWTGLLIFHSLLTPNTPEFTIIESIYGIKRQAGGFYFVLFPPFGQHRRMMDGVSRSRRQLRRTKHQSAQRSWCDFGRLKKKKRPVGSISPNGYICPGFVVGI